MTYAKQALSPLLENMFWQLREDVKKEMAAVASPDKPLTDLSAEEELVQIQFFQACAMTMQRNAYVQLMDICLDHPDIDYGRACLLIHVLIKNAAIEQVRDGYSFKTEGRAG